MRLLGLVTAALLAGCTSASTMSDYECLDSPIHTYAESPGATYGYECRKARGACEIGFIQTEHSAEQCEKNPRCEYVPGRCYCPPGMECICGGGSPGQCQTKR
jgi:hypothetical protein